jgi:hypothetical protein
MAVRGGRIFVFNEHCLVAAVSGTKVGPFSEVPIDWSAIAREERGSLQVMIPSSNYRLLAHSHFGVDRWYRMDVPETKDDPR